MLQEWTLSPLCVRVVTVVECRAEEQEQIYLSAGEQIVAHTVALQETGNSPNICSVIVSNLLMFS